MASEVGGNIIRRLLPFERNFVQLPNVWVRDERLSFAARGVLATVMSHGPGFRVSIGILAKASPQGPDAVLTAVRNLEKCGYLIRRPSRIGLPDNWEICDPSGLHDPALIGYQEAGGPVDNRPTGKSDPPENPAGNLPENPASIRKLVKNNQSGNARHERSFSPVDNSDAFGGVYRPADAMDRTCSKGHKIIGESSSGVPFCQLGCASLEVPA